MQHQCRHQCRHPDVWPAQSGAWILPVPLGSTRDGGVVRSAHCPQSIASGLKKSVLFSLSPGAAAVAVQLRSNAAVCPAACLLLEASWHYEEGSLLGQGATPGTL